MLTLHLLRIHAHDLPGYRLVGIDGNLEEAAAGIGKAVIHTGGGGVYQAPLGCAIDHSDLVILLTDSINCRFIIEPEPEQ